MVSSMPFWKSFFTRVVSAPLRRRNAAASNVRSPVRIVKFFVSSTMPESTASASKGRISVGSHSSCMSSVTSSHVDEAFGS